MARLLLPGKILRSEKGVALLIALFAMTLMTFIAVEVSYDTSVDYVVASQQVNRIRAYYAAKSGIELSLLRIMLYKQAMGALGDTLGTQKSMLDPIWNFPFMWPPTAMGGKINEVDKDMLKESIDDSLMQGQYATTITPESGKIDINDLGSPLKGLKKAMIAQVLNIFTSEVRHNEDFARKYGNVRFEELVNNIADYIDEDTEGLNGGDESSYYRDIEEKDIQMPPNRPLRTLDELHQVAGMTDEFYNLLAPRVTIFGTKGININYSNKELLMALDPSMTEEAVDKVIARRNDIKLGGPFKDDKDFFAFIQPYGVNIKAIEDSKVPLLYDMEYNFRISSTGLSSNVKREITVVTYDYTNVGSRFVDMMDKQDQADGVGIGGTSPAVGAGTGSPASAAGPAKFQAVKGRPTVVYWEEN
ncbi:MAG: general secretion pathway protein GspK [Bdellovibrionales bacterium]